MGFPNPKKEAEKAIKKAIKEILDPAVNAGKKLVYDGSVWARDKVKETGREAEGNLRKVGKDIESDLTKKLPDMVADVGKELSRQASQRAIGEVLNNAADTIELLAPSKFTLIFGLELSLVVQGEVTVSVTFPNPVAKLTEVRKWAKHPPKGRSKIIECIKDFGPESIAAELKISGPGLHAEWDGDDKYDRVDSFLAKHGVN